MDPSLRGVMSAPAPSRSRPAPPSAAHRPATAERRRGARLPALDGLRAIAVALVVAYHAAPGAVPSGLIGVDVFFVLSGFLITRGLLRERERGSVHLGSFWRRRARRILPALVLMLSVVGAVLLVTGGDAAVRFSRQFVSGLLFVSNWSQISGGEDYFLGSSPPVLQNLWSLAVEEQFYLVWPVALLMILWAAAPHAGSLHGRAVRRAGAVTFALALVSLIWGEISAAAWSTSRAYMGTDTHGFGLLAGAALALWMFGREAEAGDPVGGSRASCTTARHLRAPRSRGELEGRGAPLQTLLVSAVLGAAIASIAAAALFIPEASAFTTASPLASVLTMLVLLLARGRNPVTSLLSTRPMVAVGARSYALYLWHWPLLVILRETVPGSMPTWSAPVLAIALSVLAASFSWRFVESPVLRLGFRGWWAGSQPPGRRQRRHRRRVAILMLPLSLAAVGAAVVSPHETAAQQQIAAGTAALQGGQASDARQETTDGSEPSEPHPEEHAERTGAQEKPSRQEPDHSPGPESAGSLQGEDMVAVGDSVMLASAPALVARFPGITIDAEVSRSPQRGPDVLRRMAEQGRLRPVVVVGLGTNGEYGAGTLQEIGRAHV